MARQELWALLAIFAVGAIIRLGLLDRGGLWADEIFSLAVATGHSLEHPAAVAKPELGDFVEPDRPVAAEEYRRYLRHESPPASPSRVIRAVLLSDTSPPLYYLLLYGWTLIVGTSDVALRLFSTVCSLACLPLIAGIARRVGGKDAATSACLLFAFSPLAIYYAAEGRMYSLLLLCIVSNTWTSVVLQERGGGVGIFIFWIVSAVAGFLTHYFFFFPFLALVTYLLLEPGKFRRMHLAPSVLLVMVLIVPWYVQLWQNFNNWRVTQGWLKLRPSVFNGWIASFDLVTQFFSGRSYELWGNRVFWNAGALLLFLIVAGIALLRLRSRAFTGHRLLLWLLFAAGCAGPFASDFVQHTYMVAKPRYAVAALPAAYLLAGVAMASLNRRARMAALGLIIVAWAPSVRSIYSNRAFSWEPTRQIAAIASASSRPLSLVLVHSIPSGVLAIARYTKNSVQLASWVQQLGTRWVPESVRTLAADHDRLIFIKVHDVGSPTPEEDWLRANAVAIRQRRLGLGTIVEFQPKNGEKF